MLCGWTKRNKGTLEFKQRTYPSRIPRPVDLPRKNYVAFYSNYLMFITYWFPKNYTKTEILTFTPTLASLRNSLPETVGCLTSKIITRTSKQRRISQHGKITLRRTATGWNIPKKNLSSVDALNPLTRNGSLTVSRRRFSRGTAKRYGI